jgi:hypothetical protein
MMRLASFLLVLVVGFSLSSCAVQKTVTRGGFVVDDDQPDDIFYFTQAPGNPVAGYTTVDSVHHAF